MDRSGFGVSNKKKKEEAEHRHRGDWAILLVRCAQQLLPPRASCVNVREGEMKFALCTLLMLCGVAGCTRFPSVSEERTAPAAITNGMTLVEVVEAKGKHYRPFAGPHTGQIALVFDDITIHVQGNTLPELDGRVTKVESTTPSIEEWVVKTPYEDEKKENP